jgi:hypothetical protein
MIVIKADIEEAQNALMGTRKSLSSIQKKILQIVARETLKAVKSAIRSTTQKRTGELLKAYTYKIRKDDSAVNITPNPKLGPHIFPKVYTLNYGLKGTSRTPRFFVQEGENFASSSSYMPEVEKMANKELDKFWS